MHTLMIMNEVEELEEESFTLAFDISLIRRLQS